ncbi:hypothetical protein LARI1_G007309 [Lachnellula arida]|uniref:Uncharacterized protein n=1 Tax=Lachnellula arida TaxID=1316785 RepID=A0A8T9BBF8_9HELO|nr:hypothetical protein LARI1_G007309 [Lachnellula arida]
MVDNGLADLYDPIPDLKTPGLFPPQDLATFGQYYLYYTETAGYCAFTEAVVLGGDVVVVRYEGHLGRGHFYTDIKKRFLSQLKPCWKRVGIAKDSKGFSLREEMSKIQATFPALMRAIDTGSWKKLRTSQPLNDIDLRVILRIPRMIARLRMVPSRQFGNRLLRILPGNKTW